MAAIAAPKTAYGFNAGTLGSPGWEHFDLEVENGLRAYRLWSTVCRTKQDEFVALALPESKGIIVFAEDVLVRVGITCALLAKLSVVGAILVLMLKVLGYATPGWFSVVSCIPLLVFVQTGALTLMTLMMTGVLKSGTASAVDYKNIIYKVINSKSH